MTDWGFSPILFWTFYGVTKFYQGFKPLDFLSSSLPDWTSGEQVWVLRFLLLPTSLPWFRRCSKAGTPVSIPGRVESVLLSVWWRRRGGCRSVQEWLGCWASFRWEMSILFVSSELRVTWGYDFIRVRCWLLQVVYGQLFDSSSGGWEESSGAVVESFSFGASSEDRLCNDGAPLRFDLLRRFVAWVVLVDVSRGRLGLVAMCAEVCWLVMGPVKELSHSNFEDDDLDLNQIESLGLMAMRAVCTA